jgi:hypothetical protein
VKLRVFFAGDGDCLLLTSKDGRHALIDGGRGESFETLTWPVLRKLADENKAIDLVVVSHIDADHISGILRLLKIVAAWAVHDFQTTEGGNPTFPKPKDPRPPKIDQLWHNSWRAQLADVAEPVEAMLSRVSLGLETMALDRRALPRDMVKMLDALGGLAESIPQGVELLQLVDEKTPIPRNQPFGKLVLLRNPPHVQRLGKTRLTVIGPARKHLEKLRAEWRKWLTDTGVAPPGGLSVEPHSGLGQSLAFGAPSLAERAESQQLVASIIDAAKIIIATDPKRVTPPNRASITLLAEEDGRTCLLTGDAAEEEILEGLRAAGRIVDGRFLCNVVKVQHHGSEYNVSKTFAETVIGEHYVFCSDGANENPDPSVVKTIVETRRAVDARPFTIWFNCSPARALPSRRKHLRAAIREATKVAAKHPTIAVNVLDDAKDSHEIPV